MKDIFYRPILKPQKDYMSDAELEDLSDVLQDSQEEDEEYSQDLSQEIEESIEDLESVLKVLNIIPESERENLERSLRLILNEMRKVSDDISERDRNPGDSDPGDSSPDGPSFPPSDPSGPNDIVPPEFPEVGRPPVSPIDPEDDTPPSPGSVPSLFPDDNVIQIDIKPPVPITIKIRDTYLEDLINIYRDFVIKLRKIIENYIRDVLYIAEIGGFKSYKDLFYSYGVSSAEVPKDLRHLGDRIIRSQIERNQKARMLRKVYNIDQTIYHLRASKTACELRVRYYGESYKKEKGYLNAESNRALKKSRLQYDKKYFDSMKNFYKYLNSSSILVNEMLRSFVEEAKAKAELQGSGIDIQKYMMEEEALQESEVKMIEEDYKSSKESYEKEETERIEKLKGAGKNPNGVPDYQSPPLGGVSPSGDGAGSKIAQIAIRWEQERGVKSANPVIYSMEKRGGDMNLKKYGDCSSFTRKVCLEAGVGDIGYNTSSQVSKKMGQFIEKLSDIKPGDLMYFGPTSSTGHKIKTTLPNGKSSYTSHVAVYIGGTKYVHLSYSVGGINTQDFSSGWNKNYVEQRFIGAKRYE